MIAYPNEIRNDSVAIRAPSLDEVRGVLYDLLAINGPGLTVALIERRAAGATIDLLFRGAILVAREQANRIIELEATIGDFRDDVAALEDELGGLKSEILALRAARRRAKPNAPSPTAGAA
jgi:hypothetical protein